MSPFKSSLARSAGKLLGVFRERDISLRGYAQESRVIPPPTLYETLILMVAGGGAGGGSANGADGGGGGGGEVKFGPLKLESSGTYVFRAGDGGPAPGNSTPTGENGSGTPSFISGTTSEETFTTVTAQGGGGGGTGGSNAPPGGGAAGGSGGGGGGAVSNGTGETGRDGVARNGIAGVPISDFAYPLIQPAVPSPLQPGMSPQVGPGGRYGGGGCMGGEGTEPATRNPGGGGGGGPGNSNTPGTELTGGGGAGRESSNPGGNGGAGVIIMRIPASNAPVVTVPGGVTSVAPGNGYKYYLFSGVATTSYPVSVS